MRQAMTFERAVELAARAHAGAKDKDGETYLLHVLRVAVAVRPEARVVAALHDVIEDTAVTVVDLKKEGMQAPELEALSLLTRAKSQAEPYEDYIERIATSSGEAGKLAREVKRADLRDNLRPSKSVMEEQKARYRVALARLEPEN
jgi:(p)ppGpp synthase/HD superfamily hydrolase